ncbi:Type I restriction-modification system, DNA-methyltransferase subunit M [Brachybacterium faecium]|nr:Type I restriction-modification system, DNA-methyltransferase subunit M [Brachybacterium faecium]
MSASLQKVQEHDYILTPGRYVGLEDKIEDTEPFEEKMERLTTTLSGQFIQSHKLEDEIRKALGGIGYEV